MLEELKIYANEENARFTNRIVPNCKPNLGIYTKDLKKIAKKWVKENRLDFLNEHHAYYDEDMIHVYMISYLKDFDLVKQQLKQTIPQIENWAMCDQLILNLKIIQNHKEEVLNWLEEYRYSKREYEVRFVLVTLLVYYCEETYLPYIFEVIDTCWKDAYYVKMGIAWLLCSCMCQFKEETLQYLKTTSLEDWIYNKAIQKMIESYKISKEDKEYLRSLKRKQRR